MGFGQLSEVSRSAEHWKQKEAGINQGIPIDLLPEQKYHKNKPMVHLTPQKVFETALWIQLCDKKKLDIDFFPERISIRLPSQRHLSLYCSVSKDDMMATLNDMKNQHLIKKEHQTGTWTTYKGNRFVADIIEKQYQTQASMLLGEKMLHLILERLRTSKPELKELSKKKMLSDPLLSPRKHRLQ